MKTIYCKRNGNAFHFMEGIAKKNGIKDGESKYQKLIISLSKNCKKIKFKCNECNKEFEFNTLDIFKTSKGSMSKDYHSVSVNINTVTVGCKIGHNKFYTISAEKRNIIREKLGV